MALTLRQLEDLLIAATVSMTSLPTTAVSLAYQANSAPFSEQGQDAAYLYVTQVDSLMDKQVFSELNGSIETRSYTRVMQCQWTFYGPNSFDLCDTVRNKTITDAITIPLNSAGVFPVTAISAPVRMPEQINNQWWERSDIKIQFNVATSHTDETTFFAALRILLYNEQGLQRTINLP